MATIGQPYMGCWNVSDNDTNIGVVSGDCAIGFVARDQDDRITTSTGIAEAGPINVHRHLSQSIHAALLAWVIVT